MKKPDLAKKVEELEKRVKDLEARPWGITFIPYYQPCYYPIYQPTWPTNPIPYEVTCGSTA
jgi:hypothetical protein